LGEEHGFGGCRGEAQAAARLGRFLSLSADADPADLAYGLACIRYLSVIQTPPEERLPIKTFVTADDERR